MFSEIYQKINSILEAKTGDGQSLVEVFDYHKTGFNGYPSATFEPSDQSGEFASNAENDLTFAFDIYIHQEIEKGGRRNAIVTLMSVADELIQYFNQNWSLDGVVDFCRAVPAEFGVYDEGAGNVMTVKIRLEAIKSVEII